MSGLSSKDEPPRLLGQHDHGIASAATGAEGEATATMTDMAYDVIYIDAVGSEEPVASHLERVDAAELARRTAAERGAGRLMLPGSQQAAELRLRGAGRARGRAVAPLASRPMRIGVVGGGLMGSGIAEVCARSGVDVTVVEADADAVARAQARIEKSLDRGVRSGKLSAEDRDAAADRLAYSERSTTSRARTRRSRRSSRASPRSASCSSGSTRCCRTPSSSPPIPPRCRS